MKKTFIMAVAAMVLAGTALAGSVAGQADVVCPQTTQVFTGTARDLIVPAGGYCKITGATISRDLIQQDNAGADIAKTSIGRDVVFGNYAGAGITDSSIGHDVVAAGTESGADLSGSTIGHDYVGSGPGSGTTMLNTKVGHDVKFLSGGDTFVQMESTKIGHDFFASQPESVQTGRNSPDTPGGPVVVGNDFTIAGSPAIPFVFDGLCNLTVGRDLTITNRTVDLGFGVGGNCAMNGEPADRIGRDLIITGNNAVSGFFGPSSLNIVGNRVGRDLVFSHNTAVHGGQLEVSSNVVGRNATCSANTPAVTVNSPNTAGHSNSCG
jgi:hypothetical protein